MDNNIINMTPNIGYKKENVGFGNSSETNVINKLKEFLGIEFVNRIDKVLAFNRLDQKSIRKIIMNQIKELKKYFCFDDDNLIISSNVIEKIIEESKFEEYGARKIEKIIKDKLYDIIIDEILNKNVKITIETI